MHMIMVHEQLTKNLKKGETLIRAVRRDALAEIRPFGFAILLIVLDFFFLTLLIKQGTWGILAFIAVGVVAVVVGLRACVEWRLNALLITNERIVHVYQKGFFTRMVAETTYGRVTDVRSTVQGVRQTMFGLGCIEVQTAGEGTNLTIDGVRHPSQVQALLTSILRTSHEQRDSSLTAQELVEALTKAKKELGADAFNELLTRVARNDDPRDRE